MDFSQLSAFLPFIKHGFHAVSVIRPTDETMLSKATNSAFRLYGVVNLIRLGLSSIASFS